MALTKKEGYFPKEASIFSCELPAGCGLEWIECLLNDDKRYFAAVPAVEHFYTSWQPRNEIISLCFSDDMVIYGQPEPVPMDEWCVVHTRANMIRVMVSPAQYSTTAVGHVGMFKDGQIKVWEMMRDIIVYGILPREGNVRRWNLGKSRL
jgi:hypothetical protein